MKSISINLFNIDELTKDAHEKALENNRYINTDYNWWESDYDVFITICKTVGIYVNPQKIYFRGFYSQGDGSCFESNIEVQELINGMKEQSWRSYAPKLDLNLEVCPVDHRVIGLIEKGMIEADMWTETSHRYYFVHYYSRNNINGRNKRPYQRIEKELVKLHTWAKKVLERLNDFFFKSLEATYEYLVSDEAVIETIKADEYLFTADGLNADRLLNLADIPGEQ